MDCAHVRTQLHDLGRDRLDPALRAEVRLHLEGCAGCRRAEEAERTLDELLERRLPRYTAPEGLRRNLAALAEEHPRPAPPRPAAPRWSRRVAPALAAGLALVSGALLVERRVDRQSAALAAVTGEAVSDHLRVLASQHPVEIESGGPHQVKPWFEGKLDFAPVVPEPAFPDLRLRGGSVGYFLDRRAAVIQYGLRLHAVTLLAFPTEGLAWPAEDRVLGGVPGRIASVRGIHVILWRSGSLGYALVSDASQDDLVAIASSFAPATR